MEGQTLGKYEIRSTLGRGAMGTVYEGWDPVIHRQVAIKTVRLPDAADTDAQEELARFKREAQAAGRLHHPNIVGVFDYGETAQIAYIVMEFVDGRTLKAVLDADERLPVSAVSGVMDDLLSGLRFSHERGVIHRDIKPANLIISRDGPTKIADFGIARIESSNMTQAGTIMGTPAYMSPEQFMGQTVDLRTDIYSSGVLLFQMLTGERPFEGSMATIMHKALHTVPPKPSDLSVTAPVALDAVVARAMARRPEDRYPSAAAFAEAFQAALRAPAGPGFGLGGDLDTGDATVIAAPPKSAAARVRPVAAVAPKPVGGPSRLPLAAGAAVLVLAAGGGAAWWALRPAERTLPLEPQVVQNTTPPNPPPADPPPANPPPANPPPANPPPANPPTPDQPPPERAERAQPPVVPEAPPTPNTTLQTTGQTTAPPPATEEAPPNVPAPVRPTGPLPSNQVLVTPPAPETPPRPQPAILGPTVIEPYRPPNVAPPVPDTPVAAALSPEALRRAVANAVGGIDCAIVTGDVARTTGVVELRGVAGAGAPQAALQREVRDAAGAATVDFAVGAADGPYCPILNLLRPLARPFGMQGGPTLGMADNQTNLTEGGLVRAYVIMPERAHLQIDYFSSDGTVLHMHQSVAAARGPFAAGSVQRTSGTWQTLPPFGTDVVTAVTSPSPLFARERPEAEQTADYLRDLRAALDAARQRGARPGASVLLVHTAPKP